MLIEADNLKWLIIYNIKTLEDFIMSFIYNPIFILSQDKLSYHKDTYAWYIQFCI